GGQGVGGGGLAGGRRPSGGEVRRSARGDEGVSPEGGFNVASSEDVREGRVTDVYFLRGQEVLKEEGEDPHVVAEIRTTSLPREWRWAIFAGVDEALSLLDGHAVEVQSISEGSVFYVEEPVMVLSGKYLDFGILETALLGLLCQASGIATMAARCRLAARNRPRYSL